MNSMLQTSASFTSSSLTLGDFVPNVPPQENEEQHIAALSVSDVETLSIDLENETELSTFTHPLFDSDSVNEFNVVLYF